MTVIQLVADTLAAADETRSAGQAQVRDLIVDLESAIRMTQDIAGALSTVCETLDNEPGGPLAILNVITAQAGATADDLNARFNHLFKQASRYLPTSG